MREDEDVILKDEGHKNRYAIGYGKEGVKTVGGGQFIRPYLQIGPSTQHPDPLKGHYLIEEWHSQGGGDGGWGSYEELVDVAHSKTELAKMCYEIALKTAKKVAKKEKKDLVDLTRRGKRSNLEKAASSSS